MCHHHESRDWAALREELAADRAAEDEADEAALEAESEPRLPPIQPSD